MCPIVILLPSSHFVSNKLQFNTFFPSANELGAIAAAAHPWSASLTPLVANVATFLMILYLLSKSLATCLASCSLRQIVCKFVCVLMLHVAAVI